MAKEFTIPDYIRQEATKIGLDPAVALAIAEKESSFDPDAVNPKPVPTADGQLEHATGTFQFLPSTARKHGFDETDPQLNIQHGVRYLKDLLDRHADPYKALAEYGGVKTDTTYVPDALARIKRWQQSEAQRPPQQTQTPQTPPAPPDLHTPPAPPSSWDTYADEATKSLRDVWGAVKGVGSLVGQGVDALLEDPVGATTRGAQAVGRGAVNASNAVGWALEHPTDTAHTLFDTSTGRVNAAADRAAKAFGVGQYGQGAKEIGNTLLEAANVPLDLVGGLGTRLSSGEEDLRQGEYARGLGKATDVAVNVLGPELVGPALEAGAQVAPRIFPGAGLRVTPRLFKPRLTANDAAAVELGLSHNVPLSAATVSGSGFARALEYVTQSTPLGNVLARIKERQMMEGMERMGQTLAGGVHPTSIGGAEAGESAITRLTQVRDLHAGDADTLYDALRQHAADPKYTQQVPVGSSPAPFYPPGAPPTPILGPMQLPVPTAATKAALTPAYESLARRRLLLNPAEERALNTLEHFMNAPEYVPLTQIEKDLGSLKGITRQAEPGERNVSQGLAAKGVGILQSEIDRVARAAGPDVLDALREGRAARAAQGRTQEALTRLKGTYGEPDSAFTRLISPGNMKFLRTVAKEAPGEIPKLGRAILDDLFAKARGLSGVGNWGKLESIANSWEAMRPETKRLLYGAQAKDLDSFFLLGRKIAQNPNPSGTGRAVIAAALSQGIWTHPGATLMSAAGSGLLSVALNTKGGVKLLTQGLIIPEGGVKAAAWIAAMTAMIERSQNGEADSAEQTAAPPPPPGAQRGLPPPAPPPQTARPASERGTLPPWARMPIPGQGQPPPAPPGR